MRGADVRVTKNHQPNTTHLRGAVMSGVNNKGRVCVFTFFWSGCYTLPEIFCKPIFFTERKGAFFWSPKLDLPEWAHDLGGG